MQARAGVLLAEHPELGELLEPISRGEAVEGMESLAPVLVDRLRPGRRRAARPARTSLLCDPERIRTRAADLVRTSDEFLEASWAAAAGGGKAPVDLAAASLHQLDDVRADAARIGVPWWGITQLRTDAEVASAGSVTSAFESAPAYRGDTEAAIERPARLGPRRLAGRAGLRRARLGPARGRAPRRGRGRRPGWSRRPVAEPGVVDVTTGRLVGGLIAPALKLAFLTEADLTGQRGSLTKDTSRLPSRRRNAIDPISLKAGDYVVHEQHGVGKYVEMVRRTINGGEREYLIIEYAPARRGQPPRPAVRAHRRARPGDQVRRRRLAVDQPARRLRLGQDQGPGPQGGQARSRPS